MVTKVLKKTEVLFGFIRIPAKKREELLGKKSLPFETTLNNKPAKFDRQGRLWSKHLKNRYSVDTEITITKKDRGFQITKNGAGSESSKSDAKSPQQETTISFESSTCEKEPIAMVLEGDCIKFLNKDTLTEVCLTFFDPPYRQGKEYRFFDDNQSDEEYWNWIKEILKRTNEATLDGGAIYFMQREKNAPKVLDALKETGWAFQNLIIWKKKTSAVPIATRFSKQYQIIAYAIKGERPRVFNKLRIDPPPRLEDKYEHENGVFLTDVWDDIRELTSGFFAGDEAFRDKQKKRVHVQQTPVALLLRIILSSTLPDDLVFDPCAGTGTALVVAKQLRRKSIGIEIDPAYVKLIRKRLDGLREVDNIFRYHRYYKFTPNLKEIWQRARMKASNN